MKRFFLISVIVLFCFSSCSEDSIVGYSDNEILNKVHSNYKYPENFYTEDLDSANLYYVNTVSVSSPDERTQHWFELSTIYRDSAYQWTELSNLYSAYYRTYINERETKKYFEFRRVYKENPSDVILFRVHKSTFLDRSMHDRLSPDSIIGKYNVNKFDCESIKELIEYLIFVDEYNHGSYKVLDSKCKEHTSEFVHTVTDLYTVFGDWNLPNTIYVWEKKYSVNKNSGLIKLEKELIKTIED